MKKLLLLLLLFIPLNTFCFNSDYFDTDFDTVTSWNTYTETIDTWYDFFVNSVHIYSDVSVDIIIKDWTNIIFEWSVINWDKILHTSIIRTSLVFENDDNKDLSFIFTWFKFLEWSNLDLYWNVQSPLTWSGILEVFWWDIWVTDEIYYSFFNFLLILFFVFIFSCTIILFILKKL